MSKTEASQRILARKQAREDAQQIRALCSWPNGTGADYAISLLTELENLLPKKKEVTQKRADKKVLAKQIGKQMLEFGKYVGWQIELVPLDYIEWLCRANEEMADNLKIYLEENQE